MRFCILLLIVFTISSCASKKERAVKHLNKAISLDASVLRNVTRPIVIDTTIVVRGELRIDTILVIPGTTVEQTITEKEFKNLTDSLDKSNDKLTLLESELLKVTLQRTKDGLLDIQGVLKERGLYYRDTISYIDTIPFYLDTIAPSVEPVTDVVYKKGYFYSVGVTVHYFVGLLSVMAILYYVFYKRNSRN